MEKLNDVISQFERIIQKLEEHSSQEKQYCVELCHVLGAVAWEAGNQLTTLKIVNQQLGR